MTSLFWSITHWLSLFIHSFWLHIYHPNFVIKKYEQSTKNYYPSLVPIGDTKHISTNKTYNLHPISKISQQLELPIHGNLKIW